MDELEQRIRSARPISGHRDLPLSDRAKRELAELMLTDSVHHAHRPPRAIRRRRVLAGFGATAAVAVAVIGAIAATSALAPQAADAATPPLLPITATDETAQELLTELSRQVSDAGAAPDTASFTIQVETWTLPTADNGEATSRIVSPEVHVVRREADGSVTQVVTVGRASDAAGNPVSGPGVPPEGQVVRNQTYAPVEQRPAPSPDGATAPSPDDVTAPVTVTVLPDNPGAMDRFFDATTGTQPSAAASIQTMNKLLFEQVLSPSQQAALLVYFAGLPDLAAAGTTVDRLGRDGAVFVAVDPVQPEYQQQLIVSPRTGRILGTEVVYTGTDRTDIASPAVVHYSVWK